MTASRIVRGTKARIFLCVCAVLLVTGIIACYNNTLSQLDTVRKSYELCHQQEEHLSVQLQVITEYKQRLEKSLKSEQVKHQHSYGLLENKLSEEKTKNEKSSSDANLRFTSLQQHFNLLKTQHEDFKEECSKTQQQQLSEINDIQAKLKELQEELKKEKSAKENLKSQYLQVKVEKETLESQLKGTADTKINNESKMNHLLKENSDLQREISDLKEKCTCSETIQAPSLQNSPISNPSNASSSPLNYYNKNGKINSDANVGEEPPSQDRQEKSVLNVPNNVLKISSSTSTSTPNSISKNNFNNVRPLGVPTITPSSTKKTQSNLKVPEGVVAPYQVEKKLDETNDLPNNNHIVMDNRYQNKINLLAPKEDLKPIKVEEADKENMANEEFDVPVDGDLMDALGLGLGNANDPIKHAEKQNFNKQNIEDLVDRNNNGVPDHVNNNNNNNKDVQNDIQLEENDPEDDDVDADYGDRHHNEPAVRN